MTPLGDAVRRAALPRGSRPLRVGEVLGVLAETHDCYGTVYQWFLYENELGWRAQLASPAPNAIVYRSYERLELSADRVLANVFDDTERAFAAAAMWSFVYGVLASSSPFAETSP